MIITAITREKGTRYRVDVDGEYWYILDIEVIADCRLRTGKTVTEAELSQVRHAADFRKGKERALYLLGSRDFCRGELVKKLSSGIDPSVAEEVADRMEELGFLNDEKYARKLAHYLVKVKKRGGYRAAQEMMAKGLSGELAWEALNAIPPDEELLPALVRQKYLRRLKSQKDVDRVTAALVRLGHGYRESRAAVEQVLDEEAIVFEDENRDNYDYDME